MAEEASSSGGHHAPRDRDPPPSFDGHSPHLFKQYEREVALWQWETEIPANKHAVKMLRHLSGPARSAADEVPAQVLKSEAGVKAILDKLSEHFMPHLEAAMPKAFEKAIYGEQRKSKETFQEYVIRMDASFKELEDEGVNLPAVVRGYILYRQANLSSVQEDQVVTWTQGNYSREQVVKALRKLEKVSRDRSGKAFLAEEAGFGEPGDEAFLTMPETDHEIENFVYLEEGDLN